MPSVGLYSPFVFSCQLGNQLSRWETEAGLLWGVAQSLMLSNGLMAAWPEYLDGTRDEKFEGYLDDDDGELDSLAAQLG